MMLHIKGFDFWLLYPHVACLQASLKEVPILEFSIICLLKLKIVDGGNIYYLSGRQIQK